MHSDANYQKLKNVLREVFQLDQADLDFGIYRIMNQKRDDITDFLDNQLLPQVHEILQANDSSSDTRPKQELAEAIAQAKNLGVDPESLPKVQELRAMVASSTSIEVLEQEVYSHLASFFKRYYKEGDFISLRRYKKDVYAIPYEGEEVKLHWANHDQYYIKTSEYLKNYGFKLLGGNNVKFELKEASTEQNNNKEQSGKERRFELYHEEPFIVNGDTLIVQFTYEPKDKKVKQSALNKESIAGLASIIPAEFYDLLVKVPTEKNKDRTVLEKHINDFTARNSFDYFIHKDLGGFLSRELDFYIKNEVLYIDDINTENERDFTIQLSKIRAIKQVAEKIITFLAQLENFQKKLWLKKKFVISTNYCISLDRIPENYYDDICSNKEQLEEWKELFKIDEQETDLLSISYSEPLSKEYLNSHPFLILDTKFFSEEWKSNLLGEFDDLTKQNSGLLINSENFQALTLIRKWSINLLESIYIDPPYNTSASEILYKNSFKHSSWLTMINSRLNIAYSFLKEYGIMCITIDDFEGHYLATILKQIFGTEEHLGTAVIRNNPSGRSTASGFSIAHEYAFFYGKSKNSKVGRLDRNQKQLSRYDQNDKDGQFEWVNFRKHGGTKDESATMFYPFYISDHSFRIPNIEWNENKQEYDILDSPKNDEIVHWPIDDKGVLRRWKWGLDRTTENPSEFSVRKDRNGENAIYVKARLNTNGILPLTWWDDKKYSATSNGTNLLKDLFGSINSFLYPKSIHAVIDCSKVSGLSKNGIIMDHFSGSGTTGHAVIDLNREDKGTRRFILVEMGTYFNTVTKPRVLKVAYADQWKNGTPVSFDGVSQFIKYQDLESYEDVLNNLTLQRPKEQADLIQDAASRESYMLRYMLDVESRGSLINLDAFRDPWNYTISVTRDNEAIETNVDLIETFNYLIGLHVRSLQTINGYKVITGLTNIEKEETLVIWRNLDDKSNDDLNGFFTKMSFSTRDTEFQRIYVNGDNHLENLKTGDEKWKVVLIEEEFMKRMWDTQEV